jgi:hypothetical protein
MSDAYDKVKVGTYSDGSPMLLNKRTAAALDVVHERLGYELTIAQGSYHKTTTASAGTHDGGGAVDLAPFEADKKVHAMRAVGFAAWHRLPSQGDWPEHVHGILRGDQEMSPQAAAQIVSFDDHRNGLANNDVDNTWHPDPKVTFDYPQYVKEHADVNFDDQVPGTDNKTVGDALREALRGDEHAAAINANTNGFQAQANTRFGEQADAIKALQADVDGIHDQLAATQIKLTAILDAVKNP